MLNETLPGRVGPKPLGELHDQSLGPADIDEPIDALVILDLADRVEAFLAQSVDDLAKVTHLDSDVPEAGPFADEGCAPPPSAGAWYLTSSSLPLPSGVRTITTALARRRAC